MQIETNLDLEKRTATVTIYTDEKSFKTTYDLDKVAKQLDYVANNPILKSFINLLGFQIEVCGLKSNKNNTPTSTT